MNQTSLISSLRRFFGLRTRSQQITYQELMSLTDRQLEDIGLTRGLIETVVYQGPDSISAVFPEGAVQAAANTNRTHALSVG
jgi:uncharacterized protein YjiS (DUF1127 family)